MWGESSVLHRFRMDLEAESADLFHTLERSLQSNSPVNFVW
jgi:hypothetical protein